ncbi:MAG: ParA family protein [Holosporales bacterium]
MHFSDMGITQKNIAALANLTQPSVSRWFSRHEILPINKTKENEKRVRYSIDDVRKFFKDSFSKINLSENGNVLSFYNFKGGTGKTSICYQVSTHLALMGYDVLLIDADPQAHLSTSLGFDNDHKFPTLADVISEFATIEESTHQIFPGLYALPSHLSLTRMEVILNELPKREERVSILMEKVRKKYDFIIFDTNPTISLLNRNIILASNQIDIVTETQPYSLNGLKILMEDMDRFYRNMEHDKPDIIVIPNKYEDRYTNSAEAMTFLRQYYAENMFPDFAIRKSEDIPNSAKQSLPLGFFARSNSIAFEDVRDLIHFILNRVNENSPNKKAA